jgi:hypothetical protein
MSEEEKHMTTACETSACSKADPPRARLSPIRLLKIVAAIAVALVLMYAETWAIQESPTLWSESAATFLTDTGGGETDGPLRDTAGPIAVLH